MTVTKALGWVIGGVLVLATIVLAVLWGGFVLQQIWNWHAAPFTAIRLTLPQAVGLQCLITLIRGTTKSSPDDKTPWRDLREACVHLGVFLAIAWVAHLFT